VRDAVTGGPVTQAKNWPAPQDHTARSTAVHPTPTRWPMSTLDIGPDRIDATDHSFPAAGQRDAWKVAHLVSESL